MYKAHSLKGLHASKGLLSPYIEGLHIHSIERDFMKSLLGAQQSPSL